MAKPLLYLGSAATGALLLADSGYDDSGVAYTLLATTERIAPAGVGGECAFYNLYVPVEHDVAVTIRVTPIIDGVAQAIQDFIIAAPAARHVVILEVPLMVRFPSSITNYATLAQFAMRGTWFQAKIETVGIATGYVAVDGVELEHETLRETMQPGVNK